MKKNNLKQITTTLAFALLIGVAGCGSKINTAPVNPFLRADSDQEVRNMVKTFQAAGSDESKFLPQYQRWIEKQGITTKTVPNGMYTMLDKDGFYYAGWGTSVYKIGDATPGDINSKLKLYDSYNLKDGLPPKVTNEINRMPGCPA